MKFIQYSIMESVKGTEKVENINENTFLFSYPCDSNFECTPYKVILSQGVYQIECYGAGNSPNNQHSGGGGYTSGIIRIHGSLELYLYLGASGAFQNANESYSQEVTFNGGGGNVQASHTGSGATDVRLKYSSDWKDFESLKSRIMVAGGAGGSECGDGGSGGGLIGGNGGTGKCPNDQIFYSNPGAGASNNSGGNGLFPGRFGYAQQTNYSTDFVSKNRNCGGGGYYGGGSSYDSGAGGGGSSFISGHPGLNKVFITPII